MMREEGGWERGGEKGVGEEEREKGMRVSRRRGLKPLRENRKERGKDLEKVLSTWWGFSVSNSPLLSFT